jgi:filamentous hemagglutinin family protein
MNRHGSMNRIYRLIWNHVLNAWVAVAETARGRGKGGSRKLVAAALSLTAAWAMAAPNGGQVIGGSGSISQSGTTTNINQSSQNLSLTWRSFNVGSNETVNFIQPSASAIAVNRIYDTNGSSILGHLNANGQVYLINPNGILFGQGAQVNVGGLVATTLNFNDANLNSNAKNFSGTSSASVINQGTINAANGGYVALLAKQVSNQGTITAPQGTVALGAGSSTTLTFQNNSLVSMQVEQSVLDTQADNGGLIRADGGMVIMSAGAKDALLASVVNNTGVIEARTVENHNGTITLLGGMKAGTVNVGGTLDASAPNGGNGGFIETSAAHVKIADNAKITTAASMGLNGTWLIDPVDYTIAASGGDITGAQLATNLASTNVTILSSSGTSGSSGNVNINDVVSWSANKLTLNAQNNININANLNASATASLALEYGQGAVAAGNTSKVITTNASVNLPASTTNFTTKQGSNGSVKAYTVITSLGAAGSTTTTDLQGMNGNLALNYALGTNIDATATSGWNAGAGFATIGTNGAQFTGEFDGLGHTISGLTINRPGTSYVGMFGVSATNAVIRNVGLVGGSSTGTTFTGALVGRNYGTISNSYATGSVSGSSYVGGLAGFAHGSISNSYATGTVTGSGNYIGGLLGGSYGTLSNSYATGPVSGHQFVGGLTGSDGGLLSNSYATGPVSGSNYVGGLSGYLAGTTLSNSYATGPVTSTGQNAGGLVGYSNGTISNSYASGGAVTGTGSVGGMVGLNFGTISNSYSTGAIVGVGATFGGLVGTNGGTTVNSFWDITTSGKATGNGGVGMTTTQMQTQSNFTSATAANGNVNPAWDLTGTWVVYDTYTRPLLRSFMTPLTVTTNSATKTYDGAAYSGGNGVTYSVVPNGNLLGSLSYSGSAQGAVNAGSYGISSSGLYSTSQQGGYAITYVNGTLTVNAANLTLSTSNVSKTYDGGLTAAGTATVTSGSLFGSDSLSGGTFAFTNKNVGSGNKTISVSGVTVSDGNSGGNYNVTYANNTTSTISQANLTLSTSNVTKTYDAGLSAAGTATLTSGTLFGSDSFSGGTFAFTGKNVGTGNKTVTVSGVTVNDGNSGGNYNVTYANNTASTISQANLTLSTSNVSKTYDSGLTAAGTATVTSGSLFGSDSINGGTFAFTDKNVGSGNKTVTTSGVTVNDGNSGSNYNVTYASNTTSTISKANLTIATSDVTKTYDSTLTASGTAAVTSGTLFGSDSLSGGTFAFTNKNVGSGSKTVTTSGVTLTDGNSGGNYNVTYANNTTSTITAANLAVTGVTANNKKFDGTAAAALGGTAAVTALGTDVVTVGGTGSGTFADASVGTSKAVTVSGFTLGGTDAGNYTVVQPTGVTADITVSIAPAPVLNVTTQLQTNILMPQAGAQADTVNLSSTITVTDGGNTGGQGGSSSASSSTSSSSSSSSSDNGTAPNIAMNIGSNGPALQIMSGGVRLPNNMLNEDNEDNE